MIRQRALGQRVATLVTACVALVSASPATAFSIRDIYAGWSSASNGTDTTPEGGANALLQLSVTLVGESSIEHVFSIYFRIEEEGRGLRCAPNCHDGVLLLGVGSSPQTPAVSLLGYEYLGPMGRQLPWDAPGPGNAQPGAPVPEPGAGLLFAVGGLVMGTAVSRRRRSQECRAKRRAGLSRSKTVRSRGSSRTRRMTRA